MVQSQPLGTSHPIFHFRCDTYIRTLNIGLYQILIRYFDLLLCHKCGGAMHYFSSSVNIAEIQFNNDQGFQTSIGANINTRYQNGALLARDRIV